MFNILIAQTRNLRLLLIATIILFYFGNPALSASESDQLTYSKVQITINTSEDLAILKNLGFDRDQLRLSDGNWEAILNNVEIDILKDSGLPFHFVIDDVIEHYLEFIRIPDAEMPRLQREMREEYEVEGFEFGSMGGYYTFAEVAAELDSMRLLYPELISEKFSIGLSVEGRDLWASRISNNPDVDEDQPEILYTGLHHAREPMSMAAIMYFMYYMLENYGSDPLVTFLIDNRELYFLPVVNPDGYVYNEETNPGGGGMWRKNRRDNGDGSWGVNNNRNYGYMWGYDNLGSSPSPSNNEFRGTDPFSEPETQAVRDFCINHHFQLALNYHTYWHKLFLPWAYIYNSHTPDSAIYMDLALEMTRFNNYDIEVSTEATGVVNGYSDDWMYGEQTEKNKIFAMTPEIGEWSDGGFWAMQSRIYHLAQENVYANLILALGPGVIDSDTTLHLEAGSITSGYLSPGTDTLTVTAEIVNPMAEPISVVSIIQANDYSFQDTVPMFDDGDHEDGEANDGIFGALPLAPPDENFYTAHIHAYSDSGYSGFLNNVGSFTTAGPITFQNISFRNDSIFYPGDNPQFYLEIMNEGTSAIATDVSARISLVEEFYAQVLGGDSRPFGDIEVGVTATNSLYYWIRINADSPGDTNFTVNMAISSNGIDYWDDSFNIYIEPVVGISDGDIGIPQDYSLMQNYPNPFNPTTTISYGLPEAVKTTLIIYDITGRQITTLTDAQQPAGYYNIQWNGTDESGNPASAGLYFCRLEAGSYSQTIKMVYLR
ncbi:T9SS type A sorting domain-containing protein [bacterium]|nr:T9SS type A sorting domain-containing protein [bacterium]